RRQGRAGAAWSAFSFAASSGSSSLLAKRESGAHGEADLAELAAARRLRLPGRGGGPLERDPHDFASTHFAGGLDHQLVLPGRQLAERCRAGLEAKLVLADRTGRATDAVDRHRQPASAAPPPLTHVL